MTPAQQIIAKCNEVMAKAKELYGLDMSGLRVGFDLRGRAAGKAGGTTYRRPANEYYVKFNNDMLHRNSFGHMLAEVVPHELAHVVCFMNPDLGKNHDYGWVTVCRALGGNGDTRHREEVVYGKGRTFEYTSTTGHKIRISEQRHRRIQQGGVLKYRNGMGILNMGCTYTIVGVSGHSITPIVPPQPKVVSKEVPVESIIPPAHDQRSILEALRKRIAVKVKTPAPTGGKSKASIARAIMSTLHAQGKSYEDIITAIMQATGHNRQLSRAYYKNNAARVGVPAGQ